MVTKQQKQPRAVRSRFQGTPLSVVDTIASEYALAIRRQMSPPARDNSRAWADIAQEQRILAQAHQLGLATPNLPPGMTAELADLKRRIEEEREWESVGDTARQAIQEALEDTGIPFTAPWAYLVWGRVLRKGRGIFCGRLHWPLHEWPGPMPTREMGTVVARDWAAELPWDERLKGYRFELFGLLAASEADAERYPPEALWKMSHPDPSSSTGRSALLIETYRVRVFHQDNPVIAVSQWRPGWDAPRSMFDVGTDLSGDDRLARRGLKLYYGIQDAQRGPEVGTVKSQKYRSLKEWHAAIREKVLPKRLVVSAPDHQIAKDWLGIGTATMYRLMKQWGPSTLEDMRNGKF